jgi:lactoylglutathione lyase
MSVLNLGTVFIYVCNLEKSIQFYTKVLGLISRGIEDWGNGEKGATLFFNNPDGKPMITLVETENVQSTEKPLFNLNCEEVEAIYTKIKEDGYRVTELIRWESEWNNHLHFDVFDPDYNAINLIEIQKK